MKSNVDVKSVASVSAEMDQLQKLIQEKAYDNFQRRGGSPGGELDDWLMAEGELLLPNATLQESKGELMIQFAIPKLDAKSIQIEADSENLFLQVDDAEQPRFGSLRLPQAIDPEQIRAEYRNDILRIAVPTAASSELPQAKSA